MQQSAKRSGLGRRPRLVQGISGVLLIAVFLLPWHGARSWELLRYLRGTDFARQLGFLVTGTLFLSAALLPLPGFFRAAVGAFVGTAALCLGGVMLSTWQGMMAVFALCLLPPSLIARSRMKWARLPRLFGMMGAFAVLCMYLVPRDGVAPLSVAVELVYSQKEDMARFLGTYLLLPLPLITLSSAVLIGTEVAVIGEPLAWLLLFWCPGAILVLAIDQTQAYMATAVLCYAACASYGHAEIIRRLALRQLERRPGGPRGDRHGPASLGPGIEPGQGL